MPELFVFGVVLFALGILASVAWHECGHMWAARATGMKVRRYFVGFGPKIWSIRRGETEYGLKAIPAGGFCDIAGMTAMDELAPDEEDRAMWKQKPWKRVFVLVAGPAMNFILGVVLLYMVTLAWGLPGMSRVSGVFVPKLECVAPTQLAEDEFARCEGAGPAERAGMRAGDIVTAVNGVHVASPPELIKAIAGAPGAVRFDVLRDGKALSLEVTPERVSWFDFDPATGKYRYDPATGKPVMRELSKVGVRVAPVDSIITRYNPATAVPATFEFTGIMFEKTWEGITKIPAKVGAVVRSLGGGERDPETPMSVVGASRIGGELAEHADKNDGAWPTFVLLLASLNFVLGILNLLPLVPFDGGHIAVVGYEKVRDSVRRLRGKAAGGPVDYLKLAPATYVVLAVVGVYMVLVLAADVINPIRLF
ncbi:M50 family metallopeptidase [Segniliparus rugosus]|uniref:Zinc metalloprotease Rip1 n=1 Tax=Segniliparus rugosus (strain ATCC BAA-974 / DSM 45345 / CCUG 50838 / CIP 108380 / JCM 13579 / CDC 945) TaxID=679197 RepID=E5XL47_SEGRC|nr:site-2 protease family protein [Segniliparus rugosus]EFV14915.1 RIP metalloprotease RseP [Segniliparus rugosus ATCC BAA-974]